MAVRPLLYLLLANLIGASSYVGQKLALDGLPFVTLVFWRTLVGAVCMAIVLRRDAWRWQFRGKDFGWIALAGIGGFAAPLLLGVFGLRWSTAANASLLILLEPVGIVVLSALLFHDRVSRSQRAGLAVTVAVVLVTRAPRGVAAPPVPSP